MSIDSTYKLIANPVVAKPYIQSCFPKPMGQTQAIFA